MRVLRDIKGTLAYLLILVMFSTPIVASAGSHACCPDTEMSAVTKSQDMTAHFEHLTATNSDSTHLKGAVHDSLSEMPCDISCCANVTGAGIVASNQPVLAADYHFSLGFFPTNDLAVSAADNLHTPPPRLS